MRCGLLIGHRRFGTIYWYNFEGQAVQADSSLTQCTATEEQLLQSHILMKNSITGCIFKNADLLKQNSGPGGQNGLSPIFIILAIMHNYP
jgi:hypothetical protein